MGRINIALGAIIFGCSIGISGAENQPLMTMIFLCAGVLTALNLAVGFDFDECEELETFEEIDQKK